MLSFSPRGRRRGPRQGRGRMRGLPASGTLARSGAAAASPSPGRSAPDLSFRKERWIKCQAALTSCASGTVKPRARTAARMMATMSSRWRKLSVLMITSNVVGSS